MFTEALSLVSQLQHMQKTNTVEGLGASYLIVLGISRFSRIFFWFNLSTKWKQFWYLIAADVVHTLMVLGFALKFKLI